ncbi:MAG: flagellar biosynthesis protein FlhF [Syntrophomonadaceae bacterium]
MRIKKYLATDFQEAIMRAKKEMGQDAIILHTRHVRKRGILGLFSRPQVEITVAMDDTLQVDTDRFRNHTSPSRPQPVTAPAKKITNVAFLEAASAQGALKEPEVVQEIQKMKDIMADIRNKMFEVESMKGISEQVEPFYNLLLSNKVNQELALKITSSVESRLPANKNVDKNWVREVCLHTLQEFITDIQPIYRETEKKGKVVAMIGPTGVGKTTTIAKLAANLTLLEGKEVALITLDTYRISAAEQLKTFAEIIGVPIRVIFTPNDLVEAIEEFKEKDVIFIDTAGRSPFNEDQLEELNQFINFARPDETILVMSVTASSSNLISIFERFSIIKIDKLIFTKLDETDTYGQILNTIYEIKLPVAYFSTGQNVPDDIEVPEPLGFARLLIGKDDTL